MMSISEDERRRQEEAQVEPQISLSLFRVLMHAVREAERDHHRVIDLDRLHSALDNPNALSDISVMRQWQFLMAEYERARILNKGVNLLVSESLFSGASLSDEAREAIQTTLNTARKEGKMEVTGTDLWVNVRELEERQQAKADLAEVLSDPNVASVVKRDLVRKVNQAVHEAHEEDRLYH